MIILDIGQYAEGVGDHLCTVSRAQVRDLSSKLLQNNELEQYKAEYEMFVIYA